MKNLAAKQETNVTPMATPAMLLQTAVEKGAELDKLEKLMDLQDRWNADQAKNAFNEALANFQSELGPIIKTRQAHNSKYADIDDIAQAIRPVLEANGLSYQFKQSQDGAALTVTCVLRHRLGHSEENTLSAPYDNSGGKNAIQSIASTVTYLRRYTLTGVAGITTGNDDNDGGRPDTTVDDLVSYNELLRDEIMTVAAIKQALAEQDFSTAKESWQELDEATQRQLWRAPSKGGIFTTLERTQMKSDEWSKA